MKALPPGYTVGLSSDPPLVGVLPTVLPHETIVDEQRRIDQHRKEGTECRCCGQRTQRYRRSITASMAKWLIQLYRATVVVSSGAGTEYSWTDVKTLEARGGDYAKLLYWNLIERQTPEDGRNSGQFRPTVLGAKFVLQQVLVYKHIFIYDEALIAWDGRAVSIVEALGERFDYGALMRGEG